MKKCSKCKIIKKTSEFHKDVSRNDGLSYVCKKCRSKKKGVVLKENRKIFDRNINASIYKSIKKNKCGSSWEKLVGYTLFDLKIHIELQFKKEMNWSNFGSYWWIDKIIPRREYTYSGSTNEFKKCWSLKNMRPLEANECRRKKDKFIWNLVIKYSLFDILPIGAINVDKKNLLLDNNITMANKPKLEYNFNILIKKYIESGEVNDVYKDRVFRASGVWNKEEVVNDVLKQIDLMKDYGEDPNIIDFSVYLRRLKNDQ
jgi:hypothetical protein